MRNLRNLRYCAGQSGYPGFGFRIVSETRNRHGVADLRGFGSSGSFGYPACGWQIAPPRVVQMLAPVALAALAADLHLNRRDGVWLQQPRQIAMVQRVPEVVTPRRLVDLVQRGQE